MREKGKLILLIVLAAVSITGFMFIELGANWDYALPRRAEKMAAIVLTGTVIAIATLLFQTITNNRILTPSIIGLDSLYMLVQTTLVFFLGSTSLTVMNKQVNFAISLGFMIVFALVLYRILFKREGQNIYFLLLLGLIVGTFFGSFTSFMQVLIDPNEFQIILDRMFASFNNIQTDVLVMASVITAVVLLYMMKFVKYLDVLSLGKETAVNLGVDYDYTVKRLLVIVAVLISVATALVGPITFLGLLVVNVAYEMFKTYKHSVLIFASALVSIVALSAGQVLVEHVFTFSTQLSVIINFVGGIYFIYLLLRESKS
ncbi:iron chelate uptake ABC transporter family permease subunit [Domibacillus enclensis]|uniref:Iron ABC transporter permease n=1 Tax=Domibacillus enclensis TaxID=1017273 RepID=A0A1N6SVS2_9BACI|nr:iron chelate uptake ABC transporter family permease subunit [Domibacillus enclensis]OXS79430.1 iron ABC transporter permease [Domibacillus enclensis]SIQ45132.1 iron complex transport system permease protein [Domibacillus enclensis]